MKKGRKRAYSAVEKRPRGHENPMRFIKRCRDNLRCAYQRIKYGYCDRDVWSIDWWFLNVVPNMLQDLRETTHSYPIGLEDAGPLDSQKMNDPDDEKCMGARQWDAILTKMIYLFREANEETCERQNPYEEAYRKCSEEFERGYGKFGEKLKTPEELQEEKEKKAFRMHTMDELPEYKDISDLYFEELRKIETYRDECKNKGLELFTKWFWALWD